VGSYPLPEEMWVKGGGINRRIRRIGDTAADGAHTGLRAQEDSRRGRLGQGVERLVP